jgi:hypothetical protein
MKSNQLYAYKRRIRELQAACIVHNPTPSIALPTASLDSSLPSVFPSLLDIQETTSLTVQGQLAI